MPKTALLLRLLFLLVFATRRCFSLLPLSLELGELLSAGLLLFLPSLLHLAVVIVLRISLVSVVRRGWTSSSGSNAARVCKFAGDCLGLLAAVGATGEAAARPADGHDDDDDDGDDDDDDDDADDDDFLHH